MRRRVIWPPPTRERLRRVHPSIKRELNAATKQIDARWNHDVERLDYRPERFSLHVGGWRVILRPLPEPGVYEVEHFDPREIVYKNYPRPEDG